MTARCLPRYHGRPLSGCSSNREPEDRLPGTLAVTMELLEKGASIIRAHDVAATRDMMKVYERMVKGVMNASFTVIGLSTGIIRPHDPFTDRIIAAAEAACGGFA